MTNGVKITLIIAVTIVLIVAMSLVYSFKRENSFFSNEKLEQEISDLKNQMKQLSERGYGGIESQEINNESVKEIEKNSLTQILQIISSKFGVENPEIKNNITFEYRLSGNNIKTINGKSIKLNDVIISQNPEDMLEKTINSVGLFSNDSNVGDGVNSSIMGYNNSEIACLTISMDLKKVSKTSMSRDLEIKCGEIK